MPIRTDAEPLRPAPGSAFATGALSLAILLGCGACGTSATAELGAGQPSCASAADCDDANGCTDETCAAGACESAHTARTASALLGARTAGTGGATVSVPATPGSVIPRTTHVFCPDGPDPSSDPPSCTGQLDLSAAAGAAFAETASGGTLVATVPTRFPSLVVQVFQAAGSIGGGSISISGNRVCAGGAQTHAALPVEVRVGIDAEGALAVVAAVDEVALANAAAECIDGNVPSQVQGLIAEEGRTLVRAHLQAWYERAVEAELCSRPPCPAAYAEAGGLCRKGGAASGRCLGRPRDPETRLLEPASCVP